MARTATARAVAVVLGQLWSDVRRAPRWLCAMAVEELKAVTSRRASEWSPGRWKDTIEALRRCRTIMDNGTSQTFVPPSVKLDVVVVPQFSNTKMHTHTC